MNKLQTRLLISLCLTMMLKTNGLIAQQICTHQDGSPDVTFGYKGKVVTDFTNSSDFAQGVIELPNSKIVAIGFSDSTNSTFSFALAGYHREGSLDLNFGGNNTGKVLTNFASLLPSPVNNPSDDTAHACALQYQYSCSNPCKIIVAGRSNATQSGQYTFAIARYTGDGILDTSFGTNGLLVTPVPGTFAQANAVAIQKDDKIVVAGMSYNGLSNFVVVRYNCNGSLDTSFGTNGIVITDFSIGNTSNDTAYAIALQKNGKIVVAGSANTNFLNNTNHFALACYNTNGTLDTSFGTGGKLVTDFSNNNTSNDSAQALVILESCTDLSGHLETSKIIAVGFTNVNDINKIKNDFALACYRSNGQLDSTFGQSNTGLVTTSFLNSSDDLAYAAILEQTCASPCKIIVAGWSNTGLSNSFIDFALARYKTDGSLDTTFGINGLVSTNFFKASNDQALAITRQQNGKIIAAGRTDARGTTDFALARYTICQPCPCNS